MTPDVFHLRSVIYIYVRDSCTKASRWLGEHLSESRIHFVHRGRGGELGCLDDPVGGTSNFRDRFRIGQGGGVRIRDPRCVPPTTCHIYLASRFIYESIPAARITQFREPRARHTTSHDGTFNICPYTNFKPTVSAILIFQPDIDRPARLFCVRL